MKYFRHHHNTGLDHHKCNEAINSDHENVIVVSSMLDMENYSKYKYNLNRAEILKVLFAMKSRKVQNCWFANMCPKSVIVLNCIFDAELCKEIWTLIRKFYDKDKPVLPGKVSDIKSDLLPEIDNYMLRNCSVVAEFPRVSGIHTQINVPAKFSAYNVPADTQRLFQDTSVSTSFPELCSAIGDIIDEGFNFLRVEASEILAFVAADSDRVSKPGIPSHIPIAYGMQGPSL